MADTSYHCECSSTCSPEVHIEPFCDYTDTRKSWKTTLAKFGAGLITLCAICCTVPSGLLALGLIGISTGAYLGVGLKAAIVVLALFGFAKLLLVFLKKKN